MKTSLQKLTAAVLLASVSISVARPNTGTEVPTHLDVTIRNLADSMPLVLLTAGADPRFGELVELVDGRKLISGPFSQVNGVARPGLARLDVENELDEDFQPPALFDGPARFLSGVHPLRDGDVLVHIKGPVKDDRFVRLQADGRGDTGFSHSQLPPPSPRNEHDLTVAVAPDDTIWGARGGAVVHLATNGSLLSSNKFSDDRLSLLSVQATTGKPLVRTLCEVPVLGDGSCVRRLKTDGTFDPDFPWIIGLSSAFSFADGRLVVVGYDSSVGNLHLPDDRVDESFPTLNPGSIGNGRLGAEQFTLVPRPYLTGGTDSVNGVPVNPRYRPRLLLTELPRTAPQLSAFEPDTENPRWLVHRFAMNEPNPAENKTFSAVFRRLGPSAAPATVHYTTHGS